MIHLEEVTPDNWRMVNELRVSKDQESFVSPNVRILARAYVYRDEVSEALIICNDDEMVGLLLYREWQSNCYILDQFMIDEGFQGMGYARAALELILNRMKEHGKYNRVKLCYCKGNEVAVNLFTSIGFYHTYEEDEDDDEIIMALDF
ncbi:GNAT family N-acetyltransferase [Tissierella carlieri]|uniref:GNAT family N-acetyltransferase n=1 Tax=Tissierella carlieri TaxID=689904 RepID=UPI00386EC844